MAGLGGGTCFAVPLQVDVSTYIAEWYSWKGIQSADSPTLVSQASPNGRHACHFSKDV